MMMVYNYTALLAYRLEDLSKSTGLVLTQRFEATVFTLHCLHLSEEKLKAVDPFNKGSMPGEVTSHKVDLSQGHNVVVSFSDPLVLASPV